jgi:HEAT repeat protein
MLKKQIPMNKTRDFIGWWYGLAASFILLTPILGAATMDEAIAKLQRFQNGQSQQVLEDVDQYVNAATAQTGPSGDRAELARRLGALLETDASFEAKQFVCRQLAKIGTPKEVPLLAKMLKDEKYSDMARYGLGPIAGPEVDAALKAALGQTQGKVRIGIVSTMAYRRNQESLSVLIPLTTDADKELARAALTAVGHIGGTQAAEALVRDLTAARPEARFIVADALLACADGFVAQGQKDKASELYASMLKPEMPALTQAAALRGLAASGAPGAISQVLAALRSGEPVIQKAGMSCIQLMQGSEITEAFAKEIPNLPVNAQVILLEALGARGDVTALPEVKKALSSPDLQVRVAALRVLGQLGNASSVESLIAAAGASNVEERTAALGSLRVLGGDGVEAALISSLTTAPTNVRPSIVRVLVDRNIVGAVPSLMKMASDLDARSAIEALKGLSAMADEKAMPALLQLLAEAQDDGVREAAEQTVTTLAHKITDQSKQAESALAALAAEKQEKIRCALIRVLGGIGTTPAFEAVRGVLNDSSEKVRETAVRALAQWPDTTAEEILLKVQQNNPNQTLRTLALRGLVRLLGADTGRSPASLVETYKQILTRVNDAEEKKLVLSGLAGIPDVNALKLVEPFLKDDAVKAEAALAMLQIAAGLSGTDSGTTKQAVQKALAATDNPAVQQKAQEVLKAVEQMEDFVTVWRVAGPYMKEATGYAQLFDEVFPPEREGTPGVEWKVIPAATNPEKPWLMDLLKTLGGESRVAYARTFIHVDEEQKACFEIGSDDGVKVWLNGQLVHANNAARAITPGSDRVNVTLAKGWNTVLLKITQNNQGWEYCLRLRKADGTHLEGVQVSATR